VSFPKVTPIPHAVNRALERYGLRLTHDDLDTLCQECMKGYGRLSYLPDGKERHILLCHTKAVVVVYSTPTLHLPKGKIVTVLPPEAAFPGSRSSPATKPNQQRARPRGRSPRKARQDRGW
jgi:hypothetical protein